MIPAPASITDSSDIIRKIGLLLATAESHAEQGNQEAADSYIAKAHQLQQKYSIDQAMLADTGQGVKPVVVVRTIDLPGTWGRRKVTLAHRVGNTMDCMGYFETRWAAKGTNIYSWTAFGFAADVEWLDSLVTSLCHQADLFLAVAQKERLPWENHRTFGARFMDGFTDDIVGRLNLARRAAQKEAEQQQQDEAEVDSAPVPTGHSVSLVLASKKRQVEEEYKAQFSGGKTSTTKAGRSSSGYAAGRAAGAKANLSRGSVNRDSRGQLGK